MTLWNWTTRGISVATSVLAFYYKDKKINILDTPGHKDFAEDTFRTLTAVDSVIVVIDVAKGVEEQTKKLVEVCRMRTIPMIVFINKLDREGKDAFDLMDEVEQKLGLRVTPHLSHWDGLWLSRDLQYWKRTYNCLLKDKQHKGTAKYDDLNHPALAQAIGEKALNTLNEELELVEGLSRFDQGPILMTNYSLFWFSIEQLWGTRIVELLY